MYLIKHNKTKKKKPPIVLPHLSRCCPTFFCTLSLLPARDLSLWQRVLCCTPSPTHNTVFMPRVSMVWKGVKRRLQAEWLWADTEVEAEVEEVLE